MKMLGAGLPILMYHGLHVDRSSRGHFDSVYSVAPADFRAQLDWLCAQNYCSVRLRDLQQNGAKKRVVITFDDGDFSNAEVALPLLRERGMVAEFFVTSDFVGQPGMLDADGLRALAAAGMGVQSHGCTHRYLEDLSATELDDELSRSKEALAALSGAAVDALALPGGRGEERERLAALRLGYRYLLNSEPGPNRFAHEGHYLQRLSVTRALTLDDFAALVDWSGIGPRVARMRYRTLALPKRWLGNHRYDRWRAGLLRQ